MDVLTARDVAASFLESALPQRWRHVARTAVVAERISSALGGDDDRLVAAAWLHDIGYSQVLTETGLHGVDGARFLSCGGWPDEVCGLVAHHSYAVREAELRGLSAELTEFTDEGPTPIRDALWYCDMTTGPTGERVTVEERLAEIAQRYGPGHVVTRFVEVARPELVAAVERTQERLRAARLDHPM